MHGVLGKIFVFNKKKNSFGNSYNNDERMIVSGYDNGDLKFFDLKNNCL